jgi:hypothetical protein
VSSSDETKANVEVAHAEPAAVALEPIAEVIVAAATEAPANADAASSNEVKKDEQQAQI